jgi:hypothetical protein
MAEIFALGTTVLWRTYSGGSFGAGANFTNLVSFTGVPKTRQMNRKDGVSDLAVIKKPGKVEFGTCTLTFNLDDTTIASNQYKTISDAIDTGALHRLEVNAPGSFDDTTKLLAFEGYFAGITPPDFTRDDGVVTYTVTFSGEKPTI